MKAHAKTKTRPASTPSALVSTTQQSELNPVPAPAAPLSSLIAPAEATNQTEGQSESLAPQPANEGTPKPTSKPRRPRPSPSRAFASSSQSDIPNPQQPDSQSSAADRENILALVNAIDAEDIAMLEPESEGEKPSKGKKRAKRSRSPTGSTVIHDLTGDEDEPEEGAITEPPVKPKRSVTPSDVMSDVMSWLAEWDADKKKMLEAEAKVVGAERKIAELQQKAAIDIEENAKLRESNAKLSKNNDAITESCNGVMQAHHELVKVNKEQAETIEKLENAKSAAEKAKADMEARRDALALQNGKLDYELKKAMEKQGLDVKRIEKQDADLERIRGERNAANHLAATFKAEKIQLLGQRSAL